MSDPIYALEKLERSIVTLSIGEAGIRDRIRDAARDLGGPRLSVNDFPEHLKQRCEELILALVKSQRPDVEVEFIRETVDKIMCLREDLARTIKQ